MGNKKLVGSTRNVWVVGSKPQAVFPDNYPDEILTANGALSLVQSYGVEGVNITALVFKNFFVATDKWRNSKTTEMLRGCRADTLWITGGGRDIMGLMIQ